MAELQYKSEEGIVSEEAINKAAEAIRRARTLVITAGAGIGVDSGLPDFRGKNGLWQNYATAHGQMLQLGDLALPKAFVDDPVQAWGFYGHLTNLFRTTEPHKGFEILRRWSERAEDWYVVTSNIDGHFQKAGFNPDKVVEVHGTIHKLQCQTPCRPELWDNEETFDIDSATLHSDHVPLCRFCQGTARPNILLFCDFQWIFRRSCDQEKRFNEFLQGCKPPITIVEVGAGTMIPSIRQIGSRVAKEHQATIVRVNLHEWKIDSPHISIPEGAASGLAKIDQAL